MNRELLTVIGQIEREKGIKGEKIIQAVELAVQTAARKKYGAGDNIQVHMSPETGEIEVVSLKKIVETVTNPQAEIGLEDALQIDPGAELGDGARPDRSDRK